MKSIGVHDCSESTMQMVIGGTYVRRFHDKTRCHLRSVHRVFTRFRGSTHIRGVSMSSTPSLEGYLEGLSTSSIPGFGGAQKENVHNPGTHRHLKLTRDVRVGLAGGVALALHDNSILGDPSGELPWSSHLKSKNQSDTSCPEDAPSYSCFTFAQSCAIDGQFIVYAG
eukprot:603718-Prorocentrum_minimum.AAC.5